MSTIIIGGQEFDPYFMLDVTPDDTDEQVTKAFRRNAKKYHPDKCLSADPKQKKKMEKQFGIILECFNYIMERRNMHSLQKKKHTVTPTNGKVSGEFEGENSYGYGIKEKVTSIKDYDKFDEVAYNQFIGRKFNIKDFNKIFEYNTQQNSKSKVDSKELSLVHKTTDGFYGYNTHDVGDHGFVSSFNGLMLNCDDFGESGVGYWSNNYADYKLSFSKTRNPDKRVIVPKEFVASKEKIAKHTKHTKHREETLPVSSIGSKASKEVLYNIQKQELEAKLQKDKELLLKNRHRFDATLVEKALNGELDESPSFLNSLNEHFAITYE